MNYHQGDIILRRRTQPIPVTAKKIRTTIVAYGEVTGHTHQLLDAEIYGENGQEFVRVLNPGHMTHDEHPATEIVETGDYDRIRQFEYFPEGELETKD